MYTHFMRIQCYHSKWCFTCKTYCTVSSCTLCAVKWWVTHRVLSALSQLQTLHISRGCEPENMNDYFGERDREDFLMHVIWHQHYCFCGLTVVSSVAAYFYPCNSYDYYLLSFHAPPIPVFFPLVPSVPLFSLPHALTFCYDWTRWAEGVFAMLAGRVLEAGVIYPGDVVYLTPWADPLFPLWPSDAGTVLPQRALSVWTTTLEQTHRPTQQRPAKKKCYCCHQSI